ncbi:MAG TPA: helix-turn-helix domain-containing protein [Cyclobacteriaceae bacterium]|nr:helix-turn-helix domain-containing protein [Cyclobacteriaceae bacterium]
MKKDPPVLVGRDYLIESFLVGITRPRQPDSFQLTALRTMGATTLLRALAHPDGMLTKNQFAYCFTAPYINTGHLVLIYLDFARFDTSEEVIVWIYQQTRENLRLAPYWDDIEDLNPAKSLRHMLIQAEKDQKRVVWLCDHFDRPFEKVDSAQATALRPLVNFASFITATEIPLTELNRDAAASLFSGQLIPCNLNPLDIGEAYDLIKIALDSAGNFTPVTLDEYQFLLPLLGRHPYFILRGCEQWYEIRRDLPESPVKSLIELAKDKFLNVFRPDFIRFWNHVNSEDHDILISLVKSGGDGTKRLGKINRLKDKGLVVLERGEFRPFSELWATFIKEIVEQNSISSEKSGKKMPNLTPHEEAILKSLETRPNQVCSYGDLIKNLWHEEDLPQNRHRLRQIVLSLRQKLKQSRVFKGKLITHRDEGYELRLPAHDKNE